MWFRQLQLFSLAGFAPLNGETLETRLENIPFTPCLDHLFSSIGWVPPCGGDDEWTSLVRSMTDYHLMCCQFEEKILPAAVVQQKLNEKIKQMTAGQERKNIPAKEKQQLKEAITQSLLPRAFTKITRLYAYIDNKNQQLLLNTINTHKTEQFIALFQRTIEQKVTALEHKKISPILTKWLTRHKAPRNFTIEKACLLQDPQQQHRLIRCQEQDLLSESIQSLLQDGCEVKQLALSWKDQAYFVLADDFTFRNLHFDDDLMAAAKEARCETPEMQLQTDFMLMAGLLTPLLGQLMKAFGSNNVPSHSPAESELETV